jgi:hypothetical protein
VTDEKDDKPKGETVYFRWELGLATRPDTDALLKAFPPETILAGEWQITDEQFIEVVGESCADVRAQRFYTVYDAWIGRLEREHRIVVKRRESTGFYSPATSEVLLDTGRTQTRAIRALTKHVKRLAITKTTTDAEQARKEHHLRLLQASAQALRKDRAIVLPSTAVEQPPMRLPPGVKDKS